MPYYSVPGFTTSVTTSYKTGATVTASAASGATPRRGKCYELVLGATGSPATSDCSIQFDLSRITTTGAGTATPWTPTRSDPADGAAFSTANIAYTDQTSFAITASSSLYNIGMNQRATVRWIAAQESMYLIWPSASGTGLVGQALSQSGGYGSTFGMAINFME